MAWPWTAGMTYRDNAAPGILASDLNNWQSGINNILTQGVFQPQVINQSPLATYKDQQGTIVYTIDHNGIPMGKFSEFREDWLTTIASFNPASAALVTSYPKWNCSGGSTSTIASTNMVLGYPLPTVDVATSSTNGSTALLYTNAITRLDWTSNYTVFVMEWDAMLSAITPNDTIFMGLGNGASIGSSASIHFKWSGLSGDWFGEALGDGGTPTSVDTTIAPVAATWQRFRIEIYGQASAVGVNNGNVALVRFYINEVQRATVSGSLPAITAGNIAFKITANAGSAAMTLSVGPVQAKWLRWSSAAINTAL